MAIYSSNVSVLNGLVAQAMANPMMKSNVFTSLDGGVIEHNPSNNKRTNKRTKRCNTNKRRGR